ncbi:MAG: phosphohydrolase [Actinomycetia bacterium]|nr:phosphohydrolase [Actinomycetes bacterium]MCP4226127.1 phosphohydrolase [Actinomycetes bacterium]MCP5032998.1 phosphohydrolase [Actinomycetes bacterium]
MRLLLTSDLHYRLPQLDWVLEQGSAFDVVVLAGDLLDLASAVPLESQIVVLQTYVAKLAETTTVVVCSGNHDLTSRNDHGEKAAGWIEAMGHDAVVDWSRLDHDGVRITVCPWWDGPITRSEVEAQLEADAEGRPGRWIWIYHFPPDESPVSWTGRRHIGDPDLNAWIARFRPDLVLSGHIHDSPFHDGGSWLATVDDTAVVNAGAQPGPVPPHAIIDSSAGSASWWSAYGDAEDDLWATSN